MKVSILQESLNKGLSLVSRSVASKANLPILGNILLTTDKGRLKLSATNLETGINLWLGAKIEKEGSLTVPAKIFTEFVTSLPAEKIELEVKENTLFLTQGAIKANFTGIPAGEFPQIPSFTPQPILVLDKKELVQTLSQVVFAAAQDEGRPVLTGVLIRGEDNKICLVATDGYRLSLKKITVSLKKIEKDLLIPAKTLLEISRLVQEKDDQKEIQMFLTPEKSQLVFILPEIEFYSRLLEGEFPDFGKIIPTSFSTRTEFDKEELLKTVRLASIFAREQANIVELKVDPADNNGRVTISAETSQLGGNQTEVLTKSEGEKLEIAFNCRFLLDFLTAPTGEEIIFEANGPLSPGVFKIKNDESFLHLIMPIRRQT